MLTDQVNELESRIGGMRLEIQDDMGSMKKEFQSDMARVIEKLELMAMKMDGQEQERKEQGPTVTPNESTTILNFQPNRRKLEQVQMAGAAEVNGERQKHVGDDWKCRFSIGRTTMDRFFELRVLYYEPVIGLGETRGNGTVFGWRSFSMVPVERELEASRRNQNQPN